MLIHQVSPHPLLPLATRPHYLRSGDNVSLSPCPSFSDNTPTSKVILVWGTTSRCHVTTPLPQRQRSHRARELSSLATFRCCVTISFPLNSTVLAHSFENCHPWTMTRHNNRTAHPLSTTTILCRYYATHPPSTTSTTTSCCRRRRTRFRLAAS